MRKFWLKVGRKSDTIKQGECIFTLYGRLETNFGNAYHTVAMRILIRTNFSPTSVRYHPKRAVRSRTAFHYTFTISLLSPCRAEHFGKPALLPCVVPDKQFCCVYRAGHNIA